MRRRCAWCDESLGSPGGDPGGAVSHGICRRCARHLEAELGEPLEEFLLRLRLEVPVYLVDVEAGGRVRGANARGLELVEQDEGEARDRLLGDVFECARAALPSGCGHTVHCSGCAIRSSVEHTWRTGEPLLRVPATLHPRRSDSPVPPELEISTRRVGARVLLRVLPASPPSSRPAR